MIGCGQSKGGSRKGGNAMKKQLKLTEEKCEALEKELLQERAKKGPRTGGNQ